MNSRGSKGNKSVHTDSLFSEGGKLKTYTHTKNKIKNNKKVPKELVASPAYIKPPPHPPTLELTSDLPVQTFT